MSTCFIGLCSVEFPVFVNLQTPGGTHMLSVFIPVFVDNMTMVSFTHRLLGLKGCHVTWVTTKCVCVKG